MVRKSHWTIAALVACAALGSSAAANEYITYTYDARGRLVKVVHTSQTGQANHNNQACYKYDKADNRTNVKVTLGSAGAPPACP